MIPEDAFQAIARDLDEFDGRRDAVIRQSRDIVKSSKKVIFALNRGDAKTAKTVFEDMARKKLELDSLVRDAPALRFGGSYKVACQEYVEAATYLDVSEGRELAAPGDLDVAADVYLLGVCDLSGELVRKAVNDAIEGDTAAIAKTRDFLTGLYGQLLELNPAGELRKKIDMVRWNLNKIEDLLAEHAPHESPESEDAHEAAD